MQLGISTYTYGWSLGVPGNLPSHPMTELDLLAKAREFGLKLVQFGDNLPLHTFPPERLQSLKHWAAEWGIVLELGARKLTAEHLTQYIQLARHFNTRLLRFVIDAQEYEPCLDEIVAVITAHLPLLEQGKLTLGLENHDRLKAGEFADIIERVGSKWVGICLDSVNSMGAGEGLTEIVDILAPYTVNLHIKDFGIQRLPHLMGFQIDGRLAGKGMLNVPWLLEKIQPYGRCQTAILEQWVVPESRLGDTIRKEEAWAAESIHYLKPFFKQ
jgi:sugar phosphate isomerase/epimerase